MRIEREKIVDLSMVYVTAELHLDGKRYLSAVSEAPDEHAYIIDPQTLDVAELWQGETGVMNVIQIPGTDRLLAITRFYPVFKSREAAICLLTPSEKGYMSPWHIEEVLKLPFCHRIGIVKSSGGLFLLACQLCRDKDFTEDWSQPGALWTCPIPARGEGHWKLTKLFDGLTKNHGLWIEKGNQVYICAENGVLFFDMADYRAGESMRPQLITTTPTSDISVALCEGKKIAGVIEPFHGNTLAIYELTGSDYNQLARFDIAFGHVVWVGTIFGKPAVIAGSRGGDAKQLEVIYWQTGERVILEKGVGPTQISVYEEGGTVRVFSANHGSGEVTLYSLYAD